MADAQANSEPRKELLDVVSNSSLIDFLSNEENCENPLDEAQLFREINRLATLNSDKFNDEGDDRTIEELLKEAETLINQPIGAHNGTFTTSSQNIHMEMRNGALDQYDYSTNHTLSHHEVSLLSSLLI